MQIGVPSRTHVPAYKHLDDEIDQLVEDINWRWGYENWKPIVYLKRQFGPPEMMALHRLAKFCIVSSLDDGMNLVAKEFVASRTDGDGTSGPEPVHRRGPRADRCPHGQPVLGGRDGRRDPAGVDHARGRPAAADAENCANAVAANNVYPLGGQVPVGADQIRVPGGKGPRSANGSAFVDGVPADAWRA